MLNNENGDKNATFAEGMKEILESIRFRDRLQHCASKS